MKDILQSLTCLRRPRLLISAARFGMTDYDRSRDLKRLLNIGQPPSPRAALKRLVEEEANLEETRQSGQGSYSVARHVDIMIALMSEAHLARET